jgi:hypothetical protein
MRLNHKFKMRQIGLLFLVFISSAGICEPDNYQAMLKELRVLNSHYQKQYNENPLIKAVMDKTMSYRLDPKLGKSEYPTKNERKGLIDFEELQATRDDETIAVYRKFQSSEYVDMMINYNYMRKELRLRIAQGKITWRQFSDGLEDLIIRNRAKESDYREKKEIQSVAS